MKLALMLMAGSALVFVGLMGIYYNTHTFDMVEIGKMGMSLGVQKFFFPFLFFSYYVITGIALLTFPIYGLFLLGGILAYSLLIFIAALVSTKSIKIAILAIFASNIQLFAYGKGFAEEGLKKMLNNTAV